MLIKILRLTLTLMVGFVFCSCQIQKTKDISAYDLIISDQYSTSLLNISKTLTSEQAKEDIDFLIFALTKGYIGSQHAPTNSFNTMIANLKAISNATNIQEFHEQIDDALLSMPDNNLMALYNGNSGKKRINQIEVGQVGKNNISNSDKIWETRIERVGKKKILYISILTFPSGDSKIWKGFIPSIKTKLKQADSIVIDLRGNTGGDDAKGMELAEVLFGHPIEHPVKRKYRSQTPESLALNINSSKMEIANLKYKGLKISEDIKNRFNWFNDHFSMSINGQLASELIIPDKGTGIRSEPVTGYKKPIYILMDKSCSSGCEYTIAFFEWHNQTKRIGEFTSGSFHYSNEGFAILPNSKIKVTIPTLYKEYYDRRFIERIGIAPDVKVIPGEDAFEVTKKIIKSSKSK